MASETHVFDGSTSFTVYSQSAVLYGFSMQGNTIARVNIRNGDISGDIIFPLYVEADETVTFSIGGGLLMEHGIFFEVVAGSVKGSIWADTK